MESEAAGVDVKQKRSPCSGILVHLPAQGVRAGKGHERFSFGYKVYDGSMAGKITGPEQYDTAGSCLVEVVKEALAKRNPNISRKAKYY